MVDEVDRAQDNEYLENEVLVRVAMAAAHIPVGKPGICENCGEESKRLVRGWCAPCRDGEER